MGSEIRVRREQSGDEDAVKEVNDRAFGGPDEARIVDSVRRSGRGAISLVAVDEGRIVGHALFTPVVFESPGPAINAFGLGPMAVLPEMQRQGIGSKLVEAGLRACSEAGCQVVVVVGHPRFYPRFGFVPAGARGLRCEYPVPDDAFMVVELVRGTLEGRRGLVKYLPEFGSV